MDACRTAVRLGAKEVYNIYRRTKAEMPADQLEIEEAALKKETDKLSQDRLENLQRELAELRDELNEKKAKWSGEKDAVDKVSKLREGIEHTRNEIKIAQQNYDLEKAAELQYGVLPQMEKQLEAEEETLKQRDLSLVREKVTEEEIKEAYEQVDAKLLDVIRDEDVEKMDALLSLAITGGEFDWI